MSSIISSISALIDSFRMFHLCSLIFHWYPHDNHYKPINTHHGNLLYSSFRTPELPLLRPSMESAWVHLCRPGTSARPPVVFEIPSGNGWHSYGKSPFSMGKSTISMAIFNSYVKLPEGNSRSAWIREIYWRPSEKIWVGFRLAHRHMGQHQVQGWLL